MGIDVLFETVDEPSLYKTVGMGTVVSDFGDLFVGFLINFAVAMSPQERVRNNNNIVITCSMWSMLWYYGSHCHIVIVMS